MLRGVLYGVAGLAAIFWAFIPNDTAHATSIYDSAYQTQTSGMYVQSPGCAQQEVSSAVTSQLASSSGWPAGPWWDTDLVRDYYQNLITNQVQGAVSITQQTYTYSNNDVYQSVAVDPIQYSGSLYPIWVTDSSTDHRVRIPMPPFYGASQYSGFTLGFDLDSSCDLQFHFIGNSSQIHLSNDNTGQGMSWKSISFKTYGNPLLPFDYNYPTGYAGNPIGGTSDIDADGLTASQEMQIGTLDSKVDTDGDGISDYVESQFNPDYDNTYCKTSVTPHVCADPNPRQKDLFIEVDWMKNGSTEYKPTTTQISNLASMYANHGITAHFDLGTYGGGTYLPVYSGDVNYWETSADIDIHDYKYGGTTPDTGTTAIAEQFSPYRQNVWRYMIFGANLIPDLESYYSAVIGGATEAIGDDILIANERSSLFLTYSYTDERTIEGLMAHEIGHALCLTYSRAYTEQPSSCIFGGIDSTGYSSYVSVMNYSDVAPIRLGLEDIEYSSSSASGQHDDWAAIDEGMGYFILGNQLDLTVLYQKNSKESHKNSSHKVDAQQIIRGTKENKRIQKVNQIRERQYQKADRQ